MKLTEKVLVASGNYPVYAAGLAVWSAPSGRKSPTLNIVPGQIVIYDTTTNLSLGVAATVETNPNIVIGVGVSKHGRGSADYILTAAGDTIMGCAIDSIAVRPPTCGRPEIQDLLFTCSDANEPYTVTVTVYDSEVRTEYDYNRRSEYVFTRQATTSGCVDCDTADYSKQVACELVDAINGVTPAGWDVVKNGKFIEKADLPFSATRLFTTSTLYCISAVEQPACEGCTALDAVYGMTIGVEDPIVFTNAINPSNEDQTLIGQLDGIAAQITTALNGNGTATVISSGANCCPYSIEINTCVADVVLNGWDSTLNAGEGGTTDLAACGSVTNPLTVAPISPSCTTCEVDEAGDVTYPAGIRIIGKPVDPGSGCYIPDPVRTYLARQVDIYPSGGFHAGNYRVVDIQSATNSTNLGSQLIHLEYRQDIGGRGQHRDRPYNSGASGRYNLPIAGDRLTTLQTNPNTQYCHYTIEHNIAQNDIVSYHGVRYNTKLRTRILVPSSDTVTITDLEAFLNAYGTTIPCKAAIALDCLAE